MPGWSAGRKLRGPCSHCGIRWTWIVSSPPRPPSRAAIRTRPTSWLPAKAPGCSGACAPGAGSSGEPSAAEKTARLAGCLAEHGTLEGAAGPNRLDLTRPGSIEVPSHASTNPGSP